MKTDASWASWFAGFIDGEGCFVFRIEKYKWYYQIFLQVELRDDDLPLLFEIQEQLQMGTICRKSPKERQLARCPGEKPTASWKVCRQDDCLRLTELLDAHPLRSKKKHDYDIWREVVLELQKDPKGRDKAKLRYWEDKLKLVRQYEQQEIEDFEPDGIQLEFWTSDSD